MKFLDKFLNSITMYRLVLHSLTVLALIAVIFGFSGILAFGGLTFLGSGFLLVASCYGSNLIFAKIFRAPRNSESALITGLILFFMMTPLLQINDAPILVLAGVLAMLSKYVFAIRHKHVFNPAAIASFLLIVSGSGLSIWWAGSLVMLPFVAIAGLMIVRKIRRSALFFAFLLSALSMIMIFGIINNVAPLDSFIQAFTSWPLLFFGTYMLTEPLTAPPTKPLQILYGILVGILFGSQFQLGPIYSSPELALLVGNIFSFLVSPKLKLKLYLKEVKTVATDVYEFVFSPLPSPVRSTDKDTPNFQKFNFKPGQYLEWTLPHKNTDNRGNRRYFTIASSPTEPDFHLGVRIQQNDSSSFKKALLSMKKGDSISVSQLSGDFTLPAKSQKSGQKIVLIAGGIGITPFRSMIQHELGTSTDSTQKRDIILFYACAKIDGFAWKDFFESASQKINLKTYMIVSTQPINPQNWQGKIGYITVDMIKETIPDFQERIFYLSGPNAMVNSYKNMLLKLGIQHKNIRTDYFPGF